jgi:aryl-alcohol dehydrogenase-like predicted oxidoreductase
MRGQASLVLGSVQLGVPYGAANRTGMPSRDRALKLVRRAASAGVFEFDTARAYGESEDRLGEALEGNRARPITKLSPLTGLRADASRAEVYAAVDASIVESLAALRRERLDCLLLHRAAHLTAFDGAIWQRLVEHIEEGLILSLGVSVQTPQEALAALHEPDVRHVQLPFNILDWRWRAHGVIDGLAERPHVTVHARSVFLQGILAANDPSVWPVINHVDACGIVRRIADIARDFGRESAADLCLAYARGQSWVDGVVVGMETEAQLDANLRLFVRSPLAAEDCAEIERQMPRVGEQLLNPALWLQKQ